MAIATAADVITRLDKAEEDIEPEISALITVRLEDAERRIRKKIPDLVSKSNADADFKADVVQVEADVVLRLVRNPEGFLSETDGNYTYMLSQDLASGKLEITDDDWETLGVILSSGFFIMQPDFVMPT